MIKVSDGYANTDAIELTGGTYDEKVDAAYIADGFMLVDNGNGTYGITSAPVTVNGVGYTTLAEALAAANSSSTAVTVKLHRDSTEAMVMVGSSVTLDLNGYKLTASMLASFGNIIDGDKGGKGAFISNAASTVISANNAFMPLYDSANGCYRLYAYEFVSKGSQIVSSNSIKYGVALRFANTEAFDLIANGDSGLSFNFKLVLNDKTNSPQNFDYSGTVLKNWATAAKNYYNDPANTKDFALTLTLNGLTTLDAGTKLDLTPSVIAGIGDTSASGSVISYTTPQA